MFLKISHVFDWVGQVLSIVGPPVVFAMIFYYLFKGHDALYKVVLAFNLHPHPHIKPSDFFMFIEQKPVKNIHNRKYHMKANA